MQKLVESTKILDLDHKYITLLEKDKSHILLKDVRISKSQSGQIDSHLP